MQGQSTKERSDEHLPAVVTRAEELANRLRARILEEKLAPGSRLGTKDELARRYGVSLGTFNSAVRVLAVQRIVESRPGVRGGVFVAEAQRHLTLASVLLALREDADVTLLTNVYRARTEMDVLLSRLAAEARTPQDIRAMRAAAASLNTLADASERLRAAWQVHDQIAQAAHSPVLLAIYRRLVAMVEESVTGETVRRSEAEPRTLYQRHRELVESIVAHDVERATRLAEDHARRLHQ